MSGDVPVRGAHTSGAREIRFNLRLQLLKKLIIYGLLIALAVTVIYPIAWTIISSLRDSEEFFQNPWGFPRGFDASVYEKVWNEHQLKYNLFNSVMLSAIAVSVSLVVSLMASYAISRMKWRFSGLALAFFLMGIMIPVHSTIIPLYISMQPIINSLGARFALAIPYIAFNLPVSIFILTNFMRSIPSVLEEAAVIDGCSVPQLFLRIIVPTSLPAIATVSIFSFLGVWNELLFALVFLSRNTEQTLPLGILRFTGRYAVQWSETLAAVSIAMIPSMVIYMILQDRLIKGMTAGAVKG
ncbi:MAG: carbohydrate ABC transporter permease [Firmicutes bacterium]|nr:carbohydrate ABC transporter permease [Bacillota bacterium]